MFRGLQLAMIEVKSFCLVFSSTYLLEKNPGWASVMCLLHRSHNNFLNSFKYHLLTTTATKTRKREKHPGALRICEGC